MSLLVSAVAPPLHHNCICGLSPSFTPTMSSVVLPSVFLQKISLSASESLKSCNSLSFTGLRHGIRSFYSKILESP
uniref:Uncharacterized protein n=1 Tax=Nelumbo nucifera TaxID=4432 RepID=A0A822YG37_NELNU|nr:TPA_asm: hypothetical protein HUJ06_031667 [Nelumbo nucifera]